MSVPSGTRFGPYEILAPIGKGGMGEVYHAKDTRLNRSVAIKILPSHLSSRSDFKTRFEREARTISNLSHQHICILHDVGEQDGVSYLVMELLAGETLAERLKKGALPMDQVLRYGVEIADALSEAHRNGIVHRDLKPGNIMITKSGVKLLDFGLAKLQKLSTEELLSGESALTTFRKDTAEGVLIGTLQYMAPEQLEGGNVDSRTDIFAMGVILYEMTTGAHAFKGQTHASLIAAILSSDPQPISDIQPMTPPALNRIVNTCLEKNPDDRWQSAHDIMLQLKSIAEQPIATEPEPLKTSESKNRHLWQIVSLILLLTIVGLVYFWLKKEDRKVLQFSLVLPEGAERNEFAVSPDGSRLVFVARMGAKFQLWMRRLDSMNNELITDDAANPFWSPDGKFIGFFDEGSLKRIDARGGPVQTLHSPASYRGGTWNQDGIILFAEDFTSPLYQISAGGGQVKKVTTLDSTRGETSHRWPFFLPDGKHFLYLIRGTKPETRGTYIGSLDSKEKKRLLPIDSLAQYANGYIFFVRENNLMAQPFDEKRLQVTGDPIAIAANIGFILTGGYADFSVSKNVISYSFIDVKKGQMDFVDRTGKQIRSFPEAALCGDPWFSPDNNKIAMACHDPKGGAIWIMDLLRGTFSRFSSGGDNAFAPVWSPDGKKIVFSFVNQGDVSLYEKQYNGSDTQRALFSHQWFFPTDWSSDGTYLLLAGSWLKRGEVFLFPLSGDRKPQNLFQNEFEIGKARFSPNMKWIVYVSDESGRPEVYVRSFPIEAGGKWQISTLGGDQPTWRKDGKELFYISADNKMMSVDCNTSSSFKSSKARALFEITAPLWVEDRNSYAVSSDGQRFLINKISRNHRPTPIDIVYNWSSAIKK